MDLLCALDAMERIWANKGSCIKKKPKKRCVVMKKIKQPDFFFFESPTLENCSKNSGSVFCVSYVPSPGDREPTLRLTTPTVLSYKNNTKQNGLARCAEAELVTEKLYPRRLRSHIQISHIIQILYMPFISHYLSFI